MKVKRFPSRDDETPRFVTLVVFLLGALVAGCASGPSAGNPEILQLIDRLAEVSDAGTGFHPTALCEQFVALDEEPEFVGGIFGSKKPTVSPALRDLVRKGVEALPDLIAHLRDDRPSLCQVGSGATGRWFGNEYEPRSDDPKRHPNDIDPGFNLTKHGSFERYTLKVGDLCYVAIGQIVNRNLSAVRYQPTDCLVVNSPLKVPALARAVEQDWGGLDRERHRDSLIADACTRESRACPAMKRLIFYYPDEAEAIALKLLARPFHDREPLSFVDRLLKEKDAARWKQLLDEFRATQGEAEADAVPSRLHWICWIPEAYGTEDLPAVKEAARRILSAVFPGYDVHAPPLTHAAGAGGQAKLIPALGALRSVKIDEAIMGVFRTAAALKPSEGSERIEVDELVMACIDRLARKGYDMEFRAYVVRRIKEIGETKKDSSERYRLRYLEEHLQRLGK